MTLDPDARSDLDRALDRLGAGLDPDGTTDTPAVPQLGAHVQEPPERYTPDAVFRAGHVIAVSAEDGTGDVVLEVLDHIQHWGPLEHRTAILHTLRLGDVEPRLTVKPVDTTGPFAAHVDAALANAAAAHGAYGRARVDATRAAHWRLFVRWFGLAVQLVGIEEGARR